MSTAVLSTKGQIVIPAAVRLAMGLQEGTRVEFVSTQAGWLIKPATSPIHALKGMLLKPKKAVSIGDMNNAIKTKAAGQSQLK